LCTKTILGHNSAREGNALKFNIAAANGSVKAQRTKKQKKFILELVCNPLKRNWLVISVNLAETPPCPGSLRTRGWDISFKLSCGFHDPPLRTGKKQDWKFSKARRRHGVLRAPTHRTKTTTSDGWGTVSFPDPA
jgi:hypothetical protein